MQDVLIKNRSNLSSAGIRAAYCESFWSRLAGLMFRKNLAPHQGILLVEERDSRWNTSIHMFFMNFDLAVIWINSDRVVADVQFARRWKPFYLPAAPARYVLETHTDHLSDFHPGDILEFEDVI